MVYIENGQIVEKKNVWRFGSIVELFWAFLNAVTLFITTLWNPPPASSGGYGGSSGGRGGGPSGGGGGPRKPMGGIRGMQDIQKVPCAPAGG